MSSSPLVSIIVPCYNAEKYIQLCMDSVLQQEYQHLECILINDGSQDRTLQLLHQYEEANPILRVLTQENKGLSKTRNRGIEHAQGEFLFFLDSDDALAADAISSLVEEFDDNDIVTAITVACTFSEGKANKTKRLLHPKEGNVTFQNNNFEILIRTMETGLTPVAQNRLYRKSFINQYNLRFKKGILHEDELWFFESMLFARKVKFIDQETYFYRVDNQQSITSNVGDKNLLSYVKVMQDMVNKYAHHHSLNYISKWYATYIKKIFLDFAIRERANLSDSALAEMELALQKSYLPLTGELNLSFNNRLYYKTLNKLSLHKFPVIKKYFFRNPVNSLRKCLKVFQIWRLKNEYART